jgi:aminoglycoside phosphotransferase (APT) family kinase protein
MAGAERGRRNSRLERTEMTKPMDEVLEKVLASVHGFLLRLTASSTLSPDQLTEAHMAATALGYQLARLRRAPESVAEARRLDEALAASLAQQSGAGAPQRRWAEAWREGVGARAVAALESGGDTAPIDVVQRVREFLVAYHTPLDPTVAAGTASTYEGGRGDNKAAQDEKAAPEITAPALERYFADQRPVFPNTRVLETTRLMGGYSKQTYIVRLEQDGAERRVVIRKDGFGLPTGSSVVGEYPVLREVHALGVPVPEPLWLEPEETSPFGAAFMGVALVEGQPANRIVPTDPAVQRRWAESCAEALAALHASTAVADGDVRGPLEAEIADLQRRMQEREREPHPGLILGLKWLRENLDDLAGRPACRIHGDVGFHNFLMADDRLQAMLDWEFSRIGDPAEDLISIKSFMDQIASWDIFLAAYRRRSRFGISPDASRYFSVWREVRNMVACLGSLNSLLIPQVKDVALSVAGTIYIPKYEVEILNQILSSEKVHV